MARGALFENLYQTLVTDTVLPTIIGAPSSGSFRVFRAFPPFQNFLTSVPFEPLSLDGWVVIEEAEMQPVGTHLMYDSMYEVVEPMFHIYTPRNSIADEVIDVLDSYWHWQIPQQRAVTYGDRLLLETRRFRTQEAFDQATKLFHRQAQYRMVFVPETQYA